MAITKRIHRRGGDYGNQELKDLKSLQLNQDAVNADEAVRKSQAEVIADQAAQDILITNPGLATVNTAFTSATMNGFLAGKQDNMEIDSSSTAYLQIIDGYKIKATQLLITDVEVDETYSTLSSYIAGTTPNKQQGDVVILASATDNQERSWIKTSSASQNADGYTRLQTDYNVTSIRAMFNAGAYLNYSASTGQFSVDLGTASYELGAQTLPINDFTFQQATGNNVLDLAKSLEDLILNGQTQASQATTTVDSRISSCTGVSGSNLGNFGGRFTDESTIKDVLVETEADLTSSESDRAAIRSEFASADSTLQSNINSEAGSRISADGALQSNINSEASARISADNSLSNSISNEVTRATAAEDALDTRLDIVEGASNVNGSIAKAQADAQAFATNAVSAEASLRANADSNLQTQVDALQGAFLYKGFINDEGRVQHIDVTNPNHNVLFESLILTKGHFYKANFNLTITFVDSSTLTVNAGDGILGLNDVASGSVIASDLHKTDNTEAADLLREGQLESGILERSAGVIKITDNSIGRAKLDTSIENDIDTKLPLSGGEISGSFKVNKTVLANEGYTGGYDYAAYVKQKSIDTASLTDTQRALLVENEVYTNGSGNPLDLDYANATTSASHYKGSSSDMTVATVGAHNEASVTSSSAAIYATGAYGVATSTQLGVNAGGTFVAQNAATANLGVFAFSDTAGALNNRGGYFALSPDNIDMDAYRVARVASPLPVQDVALLVDDYTGNSHAIYVNGKSEFNGKVIVPTATEDNEAVNLGMVKSNQFYVDTSISASDGITAASKVINHNLNTTKLIVQLWEGNEEVTSNYDIEKTNNSVTIYNATTEEVTSLEVVVMALSI
jgi:hypothetical protein